MFRGYDSKSKTFSFYKTMMEKRRIRERYVNNQQRKHNNNNNKSNINNNHNCRDNNSNNKIAKWVLSCFKCKGKTMGQDDMNFQFTWFVCPNLNLGPISDMSWYQRDKWIANSTKLICYTWLKPREEGEERAVPRYNTC